MTMENPARLWVVVPAAGSSRRIGASTPKQYTKLLGKTVLEWALAPFLERDDLAGVVVVLAPNDAYWDESPLAAERRIRVATGGAERVHSVLAGLNALAEAQEEEQNQHARDRDWVLVHDAARPCLPSSDLTRLSDELVDDEVGGLLAAPSVDTLKRADGADRVVETVTRDLLWRALTPQMFRFGLLRQALMLAVDNNVVVTDESQAIEGLGLRPRLVSGDPDNIKITTPGDFERAERILRARTKSAPAAP